MPTAAPGSSTDLIDRITRLLDKAEATPYEAEAHALMAKASELAVRHTIAAASIESARSSRTARETIETREWDERGVYRLQHAQLLHAVAASHSAQVLRTPRRTEDRIILIGFPSDLDIVGMLYSSLLVQAAAALDRWWRERKDAGDLHRLSDSERRQDRKSFLDGYAVRINQRFAEMHTGLQDELGDETALVLADRSQQVTDHVAQTYQVKRARSRRVNAGSYTAGGNAADVAELGRGALNGARRALPNRT